MTRGVHFSTLGYLSSYMRGMIGLKCPKNEIPFCLPLQKTIFTVCYQKMPYMDGLIYQWAGTDKKREDMHRMNGYITSLSMIQPILYKGGGKMNLIFAKLRLRGNVNKYRKMLSTDEEVYPDFTDMVTAVTPYSPGALSEPGEWFRLSNISQADYALNILNADFNTLDFDSFARCLLCGTIHYSSKMLLGQNWPQKSISGISERVISSEASVMRSLSITCQMQSIAGRTIRCIFADSNPLRQYSKESIRFTERPPMRKHPSFFKATLSNWEKPILPKTLKLPIGKKLRSQVKLYLLWPPRIEKIYSLNIGEYCPSLKTPDNKFAVNSEDELKLLLCGIEQRFYTTLVGNERRIANSVIPLG